MGQPADLVLWASDTNISSGTESGTPTKVDPGAAYEAQGGVPGQPFVAPYWNWALHNHGLWLQYLQNLDTDPDFLGANYAWTGHHTFTELVEGLYAARFTGLQLSTSDGVRWTDGSGTYDPKPRSMYIPLEVAHGPTAPTGMWLSALAGGHLVATGGAADGCIHLRLPKDFVLNSVSVGLIDVAAQPVTAKLYRDATDPLTGAISSTQMGSTGLGFDTSSGSGGIQVLSTGGTALGHAINNASYRYRLLLQASAAGAHIKYVRVTGDDIGYTGNG